MNRRLRNRINRNDLDFIIVSDIYPELNVFSNPEIPYILRIEQARVSVGYAFTPILI